MLSILLATPLVATSIILISKETTIRYLALLFSLVIFNYVIFLFTTFDTTATSFQMISQSDWVTSMNFNVTLAIDGISYFMILLTAFLIPICILLCWNFSVQRRIKTYIVCFFILEFILFGVFTSLDLLIFYILFEAVLIPMFIIVGTFGSRERKSRAAYLLFLYTLVSSVFMLVAMLYLHFSCGSLDFLVLRSMRLDFHEESMCWLAFSLSFAVKMPLIPFHIWLPEAHCEAPTAGSVILAGILLKLGGYGFIRFCLGLFYDSSAYFAPLIYVVCCFGVIYASLTTLQQVDLKKIIAYSSVGHMAIVTIGIFSLNITGLVGSIILMLSHGIVSGGLFLAVGMLYDRYHTRIVKYYSGLMHVMPMFSVSFIVFSLGNIGLPGTSSFIGEFMVLVACFITNPLVALLSAFGMILGAGYSLWLCNRLLFGNLKQASITKFRDLTRLEFFILLPFIILTFVLGIYPETIISVLISSVSFV